MSGESAPSLLGLSFLISKLNCVSSRLLEMKSCKNKKANTLGVQKCSLETTNALFLCALFLKDFTYICMSVHYLLCQKRVLEPLELELQTGGLPCGCWGRKLGVLQEQQELLTEAAPAARVVLLLIRYGVFLIGIDNVNKGSGL